MKTSMIKEETVIYTDGACLGNPGPGGWAWVQLVDNQEHSHDAGSSDHSTNNKMELTAVIAALTSFDIQDKLHIITDSTYVVKGVQEWLSGWKKCGWISSTKKPVANQDLWKKLDALVQSRNVRLTWVRGHEGTLGNELADKYAVQAAKKVVSKV